MHQKGLSSMLYNLKDDHVRDEKDEEDGYILFDFNMYI